MQHTRQVLWLLFSKVLFEGDIGMISVHLSHDRWPFPSPAIPAHPTFHPIPSPFPFLPVSSVPIFFLPIPFYPISFPFLLLFQPAFFIPSHFIPFLFPFHPISLCSMSPREGIGWNGLHPSVCVYIPFLALLLVGDIQLQIDLFCLGFYRAACNADAVLWWEFCLSVRRVCPSHAWIVTKRKKDRYRFLYHTKEHLAYFSEKKNGWWGRPLPGDILGQPIPIGAKAPIFNQ